jgi:hypothetical protein
MLNLFQDYSFFFSSVEGVSVGVASFAYRLAAFLL